MKIQKNFSAIDLFCGCGGISHGLEVAGFSVLAGVDIEKKYLKTFEYNFPDSKAICADLRKIEPARFLASIGLKYGELDLLAGGPPCQGFSKNVPRSKREADSANNQLINTYLEFCESICPRWIMIENVAEMRNGFDARYTEKIETKLTELGYSVIHGVHNAADYGIPQKRRRAFFLARRDGKKLSPPYPLYAGSDATGTLDLGIKKYITVWEAISDLPSLHQGEGKDPCEYQGLPANEYQEKLRSNQGTVYNHIARKLQPTQNERIQALQPGEGIKNLPENLKPKGGYSGAYGILTKDMVCPTITRWVFHPGSGRWGHPVDKRLITIREAARLHSFTDNFRFIGTYIEQAGQIGNAVPPLLVAQIAASFIPMKYSVVKP
jgi:DNA (cytosine-5)-methyltransferase 1